jgi:hypothetical protein
LVWHRDASPPMRASMPRDRFPAEPAVTRLSPLRNLDLALSLLLSPDPY